METYGVLSLLPPLVAIVLCIATKQLVISLFLGAYTGGLILAGGNPITAFTTTMQYIIDNVADGWNASILVFTLVLGGFIGLLGKSGGMQGLVNRTIHFFNTRVKVQFASAILSILLFFDDYTSIILSGVVSRPLTDKLRVSREKLSYIVDSAGAGVAATSPISNWTAYEVGVIGTILATLGMDDSPYMVFLGSIPYRFYCIISVAFIFFIIGQKRDFGKMYKAEKRAIETGRTFRPGSTPASGLNEEAFKAPEGAPLRARNFFIPLIVFFVVALIGFWVTGGGAEAFAEGGIATVMGNANVIGMMIVAIVFASIVLGCMMKFQKIMNVTDIMNSWTDGMKAVYFTIVFIVLAWTISSFCKALGTANFVVGALVAANFPAWILPTAVFAISGLMAFATGSSWGTMALVLPLAMPAAVGLEANFYAVLGAVLTGATLGDHISPISESVVMSSMSSSCDHMDHVTTQWPYAFTVCAIAIICGFIPAGLGVPVGICLVVALVVAFLVVRIVGKPSSEEAFGVAKAETLLDETAKIQAEANAALLNKQ